MYRDQSKATQICCIIVATGFTVAERGGGRSKCLHATHPFPSLANEANKARSFDVARLRNNLTVTDIHG